MKRPLWLIGTGILLAIVVAFSFSTKTAMLISLTSILSALLFLALKKEKLKVFIIFLLSFSVGLALGARQVHINIVPFEEYKGEILEVHGLVEEVAQSSPRSVRYTLWASFPQTELPDSRIIIRNYTDIEASAGERISCTIKFDDPKYPSTQSYYNREGIPGEGILTEFHGKLAPLPEDSLKIGLINLRKNIYSKNNSVFSKKTAALVNGMVFGITKDLEPKLYHQLNRSGTSHLLSVSGLHLSVFAGFVLWLLGFTRLNPKIKNLLAMLAVTAFALLVGFSAPLVRSLVMTLLFLFGGIIGRDNDSLNALGFSAIMIGIFRPYWVLSLGMWLSFLSTGGILVLGTPIAKAINTRFSRKDGRFYNKLVSFLSASFGITLGAYAFTLPLLIFAFGWVSLISPFANLLVGSFSTLIVILGILTTLLPTGVPFYPIIVFLVELSSKMIIEISSLMASIPFALFSFRQPLVLLIFVTILVLVILLLARGQKKRLLPILLAGLLVFSTVQVVENLIEQDQVKLTVLDSNHTLLIRNQTAVIFGSVDTYTVEDLIKYLDYQGVHTIDALIMVDHSDQLNSGIYRLVESYHINSIVGPDDAYVLELLSNAIPGHSVYSSGYASLELLGGIEVEFESNDINITIGDQKIVLTDDKYDIIDNVDPQAVYVLEDGTVIPSDSVKASRDLLGEFIYDREEFILPIAKGG